MSDTPRTDEAYFKPHATMYDLAGEMKLMERELNAANERIRILIAERDTARRQADQNYKLREEFRALLGTDDVATALAVVREMKDRIKRLEEAGDALRQASRECCDNCEEHMGDALVEWRKAKEAKP